MGSRMFEREVFHEAVLSLAIEQSKSLIFDVSVAMMFHFRGFCSMEDTRV